MKIVIAAHTPIGSALVVGSHHLLREFTYLNHQTYHFCLPFAIWDLLRKNYMNFSWVSFKALFFKKNKNSGDISESVTFSFLPKRIPNIISVFSYLKLYSAFTFSTLKIKECDVLIIDHPYQAFTLFRFKPRLVVYRPTDIYCDANSNMPLISAYEEFILKRSDAIIATSQVTINHLKATYSKDFFISNGLPKPISVITNGVNLRDFINVNESKFAKPTAVYVGSIDFRFDLDTCIKLAETFQDFDFLIIGPVNQLISEKLIAPNIKLMGAINNKELPKILVKCHVGLLLANDHVFNKSRSPMKLYEYASAGLPVVSSNIEEVRNRKEQFVLMYDSFDSAITAFRTAFANREALSVNAKLAANSHGWAGKAQQYLNFISGLLHEKH
jgi:teichuronic acid biosynthesis glycosyltransferase TuaH